MRIPSTGVDGRERIMAAKPIDVRMFTDRRYTLTLARMAEVSENHTNFGKPGGYVRPAASAALTHRVEVVKAKALRGEGKSIREIARKLGVGGATLHRALRAHEEALIVPS